MSHWKDPVAAVTTLDEQGPDVHRVSTALDVTRPLTGLQGREVSGAEVYSMYMQVFFLFFPLFFIVAKPKRFITEHVRLVLLKFIDFETNAWY